MPLEFPFGAARDVAVQARALADDLRRLGQQVDRETDTLVPRLLRGAFAGWFADLRLASGQALRAQAEHLDDQADVADALVATATRRLGDRDAELEHWHRRHAAWTRGRAHSAPR